MVFVYFYEKMLMKISFQDKLVFSGILLYFIICTWVSFSLKGTVDSGDSITHFLFSKYSFVHPSFFIHHWAKPLFVLLSSPFAQAGMTGMKMFNSLVSTLTLIFTYLTAKKIINDNSFLSIIILCFAPLNFTITFSGLTEPLFAFWLIFSIFLLVSEKEKSAVLFISFLPFIRSEGLILLGIFAFYLIINRKFRIIPLLLTGHVVYSLAGYIYYHDLLWVFTKIPYAKLSSTYGSGPLLHFVNQMIFVIGIPFDILLYLGIVFIILSFFFSKLRIQIKYYKEKLILVYGGFLAFLVAHSLFWYLGIFNSMGLKRVMICVIPLMALIAIDGYNLLTRALIKKKSAGIIAGLIFIAFIVVFPFTGNPAAIKWSKEFSPGNDQILMTEMTNYIKKNYSYSMLYYDPPFISLELGIDHFDTTKRKELPEIYKNQNIEKDALIIWDNWFAVVENGISLEQLQKDTRLKEEKVFELPNVKLVIFTLKDTIAGGIKSSQSIVKK
jgi:hypothetical protein